MNKEFLIIAVTAPGFYLEEASKINSILANNEATFIHIRKPGSTVGEIETLINEIKPEFHKKLKLHDHFELLEKYNLGGIHLNARNPEAPEKFNFPNIIKGNMSVSKSIHSLNEIECTEDLDYFFISPIFDSISKKGYKSAYDLNILATKIKRKRAIALGGVTPDKFPLLKGLGFYGAALLGHFFPPTRGN